MSLGRNDKRRRKRNEQNYGPRAQLIRDGKCAIHAKHFEDQAGPTEHMIALIEEHGYTVCCQGSVEVAHVAGARGLGGCNASDLDPRRPRGTGEMDGTRGNLGLCTRHHVQSGEHGTSMRLAFQALFDVDLDELARAQSEDFDRRGIA